MGFGPSDVDHEVFALLNRFKAYRNLVINIAEVARGAVEVTVGEKAALAVGPRDHRRSRAIAIDGDGVLHAVPIKWIKALTGDTAVETCNSAAGTDDTPVRASPGR